MWAFSGYMLGLAGWVVLGWFAAIAFGRVAKVDFENPRERARRVVDKKTQWYTLDLR